MLRINKFGDKYCYNVHLNKDFFQIKYLMNVMILFGSVVLLS